MKKGLYSRPDAFSVSPLIALLPLRGEVAKLKSLSSSLYARYEKVLALKREDGEVRVSDAERQIHSEAAMLKEVLEWISEQPEEDR